VAVNQRLLRGSLLVAVVAIVVWVAVLATRDTEPDFVVPNDDTTDVTEPGIATNDDVVGRPLPDAPVQDLAGDTIRTSQLIGRPLVINIWFSTCAPCREELPAFASVSSDLGGDVDFVGINQFPASQREEDFARDLGVTYPLFYDGDSEFITALGIVRYPVTLFVDADGTIERQSGQLDADELRSIITADLL
jgi:thiol-disulfide isomerase/thioredoxin